jgi:hypothetical protein
LSAPARDKTGQLGTFQDILRKAKSETDSLLNLEASGQSKSRFVDLAVVCKILQFSAKVEQPEPGIRATKFNWF